MPNPGVVKAEMSEVTLRHCWLRAVFRDMAGNQNAGKASLSGEAAARRPRSPMIPFSRRKQSEFETSFAVVSSRMPRQRSFPTGLQLRHPCGFQPASLPEFCTPGSWVIGANMQCKRFVALQLEVAHHFIERCAGGAYRRV